MHTPVIARGEQACRRMSGIKATCRGGLPLGEAVVTEPAYEASREVQSGRPQCLFT
jgi:hypothetical protein